MATSEYKVTGMTCAHCEGTVRGAVEQISGVGSIDVSAATGTLVVTSESPVEDAVVLAAVGEAGYSAVRVP